MKKIVKSMKLSSATRTMENKDNICRWSDGEKRAKMCTWRTRRYVDRMMENKNINYAD
jgi:hypothetical protein